MFYCWHEKQTNTNGYLTRQLIDTQDNLMNIFKYIEQIKNRCNKPEFFSERLVPELVLVLNCALVSVFVLVHGAANF